MHILARGDWLQRARLVSGLLLFVFALAHFLNTAIGLVSLEQMDEVDRWRVWIIRSVPGTIIFASALVIHIVLALYKLARRSTLRLPIWELVQIAFGLLIPFLLFPHIVNTRIASSYFGVVDNYLYELARLWPANAILQSTLLILVWVHGCLGIHFWLRLHEPYRAIQPALLFLAISVPLAALGGFMISGRAVATLIENPEVLQRVKDITRWPNAADGELLGAYRTYTRLGFLGILVLVAIASSWRYFARLGAPKVSVSYTGGPTVTGVRGSTLLEISRANRIAHASICGGRARCSTCRVRVEEGVEGLSPPVFPESITLAAIEAPHNVRLACQIRPTKPITVTRLLRPASTGPQAAGVPESDSNGTEKQLAVLYVNMREFADLSAKKLPYDVVFLLNEFFATLATAIKAQGGTVDKFIGDGVLAVFGQKHGPEAGCRQALRSMRAIDLALDHLNSSIAPDLGRPISVAAGIHSGPMIIGRLGYGEAVDLTVIGDAAKTVLELTELAKERGVQVVLTAEVARLAGWEPHPQIIVRQVLRSMGSTVETVNVPRGRDLAVSILAPGIGEAPQRPSKAAVEENKQAEQV